MTKRYLCQAAVIFLLGIVYMNGFLRGYLPLAVSAAVLAAVLSAACIRRRTRGWKRPVQAVVLLLAFGIGAVRMYTAAITTEQYLAGILNGQEVTVQGRVTKKQSQESAQHAELWTIYLTDSYRNTSQGVRSCGDLIVSIDLKSDEPVIGNTIVITGKIKLWNTARNEGNFDESAYYIDQGYAFKIYADQDSYRIMEGGRDDLREFLYRFRQKLTKVYQSYLREPEAGILCTMLLGEKSLLAAEMKEQYRQSGIAHILAISGLHISILGAAVFGAMRKIGLSYGISAAGSVSLLLLFGLMTGMGLSTLRAVVMFSIYLGAACCGRAYDSITALAVAAVWILWQNPRSLFLAGFQFSFAAVAGVLLGQQICRVFQPKYRLMETILVSIGIQMATLPLTVWYYYEIPVYAVVLNMLVLPFMGLVLASGLLGGVCAALMPGGAVVSKGLFACCSFLLRWFSRAGEGCLRLPGAVYTAGRPHVWQMAGYGLLLAACIASLARSQKQMRSRRQPCGRRVIIAEQMLCLGILLFRFPMRMEVVILDVGQGDGIYIHTSDGMDIMIDGGSTDVKQAGTYRILPFLKSRGIAGIDYWFLSHLDQDHISGFAEIAESGYPVGEVVCASGIVKDEAYEKVMDLLALHQIKVRYLHQGDQLRSEEASFRCLAPGTAGPADDRNANSFVLLYEDGGFRGFFSGDISQKEEQKLQESADLSPVTLYKAAHHGSAHSNAQALLARLRPQVSVVSCAKDNRYGHPGEEAVANMEAYSGHVAYTMHNGQISILPQKEGVAVRAFWPKQIVQN